MAEEISCIGCPHHNGMPDRWPCSGCVGGLGRFLRWQEGPRLERPENRGDDMKSPTVPEVMK